jgi:hypothetical protein
MHMCFRQPGGDQGFATSLKPGKDYHASSASSHKLVAVIPEAKMSSSALDMQSRCSVKPRGW